MAWKKISSEEVYRNRFMRVTEDEVETESGKRLTYGVVHKKPFALTIPWDGEKFTLVGEYRYFVNSFSWGFPQGHYEHNSIKQTASQELQEETGQTAKTIKKIGSFWIGPGAIGQECFVFFATDLSEGKFNREETEEGMEIKKVTLTELREMIRVGKIKDGPTITALNLLELSGLM
ncbi:MAG: NUDIX hydrolase [Parcubacteria group bacterium]|jgi:ADP-ribose pyrophosphatase